MIGDGVIIRYRRGNDDWTYEVCDEDDLDSYYNTESDYSYCSKDIRDWAAEFEWEVVHQGIVSASNRMIKRFNDYKEEN